MQDEVSVQICVIKVIAQHMQIATPNANLFNNCQQSSLIASRHLPWLAAEANYTGR